MMPFTVKFVRGSAVLLTAAILSACGQSDSNASNASPSTANAANASSGEANAMQSKQTVTETPANNPDLLKTCQPLSIKMPIVAVVKNG